MAIQGAAATIRAWIRSADAPTPVLHDAIAVIVADWQASTTTLRTDLCAGSPALDEQAAMLAAMRRHSPIPRVVRMPLQQRAQAYRSLLGMFAGIVEQPRSDKEALERMLGLRSGHAGGLAEAADLRLDGAELSLLWADPIGEPATGHELELARLIARLARDWLPILMPIMLASFGAKAEAFGELCRRTICADSSPIVVDALLFIALLTGVARQGLGPEELRSQCQVLGSGTADLELLKLLPKPDRQATLTRLPPARQLAIMAALRGRGSSDAQLP